MSNEFESIGPASDGEILSFLSSLNANRKAYYATAYPETYGKDDTYEKRELIAAEVGPKYVRLVTTAAVDQHATPQCVREVTTTAGRERREVRSAFLFIDRATGNILKAGGFKSPAKGVRGNIRDPHYWLKSVTPYGAAYLR